MGRDFPSVQTGPGAHPASCTMGTGYFPGVKYGRGVLLTTHPLLVPWSWKSRAILLPTFWATTGTVMGTLYLYLLSRAFVRICIYSKWGQNRMFSSRRTADTIVKIGMQIGTSVSLFVVYVREKRHSFYTDVTDLCFSPFQNPLSRFHTHTKKSHPLRIVESARNSTKLNQFALCVCLYR